MNTPTTTSFSNRCDILGELWFAYREDSDFADFIEYNDLGLPLAYAISREIISSTKDSAMLINETWQLLLDVLGLEDTGYESLSEVLSIYNKPQEVDEFES